MMKHRWKESKSFVNHIDPEKDEQLKWIQIEIDTNTKRSLKLIKSLNQGNKEVNLKKKSELIQLIEDFHKQYQSLYDLYDNLKGEVRKKINRKEEDGSASSDSESELYFSTDDTSGRNSRSDLQKLGDSTKQKQEASDLEEGYLKDKLTSTSEVVKEALNVEPVSSLSKIQESGKIVEDLEFDNEHAEESTNKKHTHEVAETLREEILGLRAQILELETNSTERENELSVCLKKLEENEKHSISKIEELMSQANNLRSEVDSLRAQKGELEERLLGESNKESAQVKSLTDRINVLQQELGSLSSQKTESELQLEKKSQEMSECLIQLENLKDKLASKNVDEKESREEKGCKDLEMEVNSLYSQKSDLEEQIISINQEANARIVKLERRLTEREDELSTLLNKIEVGENDMSSQITTLTAELNNLQMEKSRVDTELTKMEQQNAELTNKVADQQRTLKEWEEVIEKFNQEHKQVKGRPMYSKSNLLTAERKMEEMAEEFRKKFEDNLRILSRRIRVAEQLHVENKDWYIKTKAKYEQEHRELKESIAANETGLKKIKDVSLTANDTLTSLEKMALNIEECSANFMNRTSKVSCELKFAKDWVMRKNKAIMHVKEDLDCLLAQLDDKEAEILVYREKVWKSENKVRELEKMVKEKDEGMLGLQEEKREAIRQLCVWIDYHRSRSDYLKKKLLSEMTVRNQRTP